MVSIRNLSVHAGQAAILRSVTAELADHCLTVIVGPNGAGKSTLFRAMCGDIRYTEGDVLLENRGIRQWPLKQLALRRAVLPQKCVLSFPFTAREVVELGRIPRERSSLRATNERIVRQAMETAEVDHLADRAYPTLSGGEQQRVQLARALAQVLDADPALPRYLWLDEPTSGLDLAHQHHLLRIARAFADSGACVVCILHDLNLAAVYADQLLVLHQGRLAASGRPASCITAGLIREVYGVQVQLTCHPTLDRPQLFVIPPVGESTCVHF